MRKYNKMIVCAAIEEKLMDQQRLFCENHLYIIYCKVKTSSMFSCVLHVSFTIPLAIRLCNKILYLLNVSLLKRKPCCSAMDVKLENQECFPVRLPRYKCSMRKKKLYCFHNFPPYLDLLKNRCVSCNNFIDEFIT